MSDDRARIEAELAKVEKAIAAQEGLRGILPDEQIEDTPLWVCTSRINCPFDDPEGCQIAFLGTLDSCYKPSVF